MASVTPALRRTVRPSAKTSEQSRDRNEAVHWPRDMPGTTHLAAARGIPVPMAVRAGVRWLDLAIIVTYVLGLTAIGLRFSRRQTLWAAHPRLRFRGIHAGSLFQNGPGLLSSGLNRKQHYGLEHGPGDSGLRLFDGSLHA